MREFKAVVNRNEYISDHYLAELMGKDLAGVRARWKAAQLAHRPSSLQGLSGLGTAFHKAKSVVAGRRGGQDDAADAAGEGFTLADPRRVAALREFHDVLLEALAFPKESTETHTVRRRELLDVVHLGAERQVAAALAVSGPGGFELVALEATWCDSVDAAVDSDAGAQLLDPIKLDGKQSVEAAVEAAGMLFGCEDAPRYVLLLCGGVIVLADAYAWHEGRYLALDLGLALSLRDELETAAALFGAESLLTQDGGSVLSELVDKGRKHAVGVSKELREGLRESVELIAQEILDRITQAGADPADLGSDLPRRLTQQALRYLYRILFLLYAEARPELGILPSRDEAYQSGYGLGRLGELVSYDLPEESAKSFHFYDSLDLLFRLVDKGHRPLRRAADVSGAATDADAEIGTDATLGIRFEPLRSDLFRRDATPLIGPAVNVGGVSVDTRLRNRVLWQVLEKLMLTTREQRGGAGSGRRAGGTAGRGYISYTQLGINQLGAVYEGLMSYTGFFADQDLYEVAKDGDPAKGTWVLPVDDRADAYDPAVFVMESNSVTGELRRKVHPKGSFVYRLSGRERQRSASYYTPEVLTEFTVRHALAELIGEDDNEQNPPKVRARDILDLTVCEPALGSGAFLNEAIRQLAATYLKRRAREIDPATGKPFGELPPDRYEAELQRAKAYIALHNSYGVDLNQTAVELAEVSLWLNSMHEGLQAPWFGLHLRRGNSLIGARRAVYDKTQLKRVNGTNWLSTPPTERPLREGADDGVVGESEIHHFLLPAHGWGAVADAKQAKELAAEERDALAKWRAAIRRTPSATDTKRLLALARRVERLWELATKRLIVSESEVRRHIDVWQVEDGRPLPESSGAVTREEVEAALNDPESPMQRLQLVMDAWCALWFWPIGQGHGMEPPDFEEWLTFLEAVLGKPYGASKAKAQKAGGDTLGLFAPIEGFHALRDEDENDRILAQCAGMLDVAMRFPWLAVARQVAAGEGFFHWELRFAQVFRRGGFDLQVGNPPWVRPFWDDTLTLAEFDPWFALTENIPQKTFEARRSAALGEPQALRAYMGELASWAGLNECLGSYVEHPALAGVQTNVYMSFMDRTWRNMASVGAIGLIHPVSHLTDPKAGALREQNYQRLRRLIQFGNHILLFAEIDNNNMFGVSVYGGPREVDFRLLSRLAHPATADGSFTHSGEGELPSIQYAEGGWDLRPHRARIVEVTDDVLRAWADLIDPPGTPARQARIMRPVTSADNDALQAVSRFAERLGDHGFLWSAGLHEKGAKQDGLIEWESATPRTGGGIILQGPLFTVATPFAKQPNPACKSNKDYTNWDLTELPTRVVPRTNYQRVAPWHRFRDAQIKREDGVYLPTRWRVTWRNMTVANMERALHAALLPPGPTHVHTVHTMALTDNRKTATVAGLWASLPLDYLVKVSGASKVNIELARQFPAPLSHPLTTPLLLRTLRLNCLTRDYAPIWSELFDDRWLTDTWTAADPKTTTPLHAVTPDWTMSTPLRTDYDRRMALVEIDALVALMLGLTAEQLCAMYRSQFAVLRKYEWEMFFHPDGHKIGASTHNVGVRQTEAESETVKAWKKAKLTPDLPDLDPPVDWIKPDREAEMTRAYEEFSRRLAAGAYADAPPNTPPAEKVP